jgi:hypothetical protein
MNVEVDTSFWTHELLLLNDKNESGTYLKLLRVTVGRKEHQAYMGQENA